MRERFRIDQCISLTRASRYAEAVPRCRDVQSLSATEWRAERGLALAARGLGKEKEALQHFLKAELLLGTPPATLDAMRAAGDKDGLPGFWRERIKMLLANRSGGQRVPYSNAAALALSYAALGDKEETIRWLGESFAAQDDGPLTLRDPSYDPFRSDPRFQELARRVGI